MPLHTVAIPLSKPPLVQAVSTLLGTLAFPVNTKKAGEFATAYWRETMRRTAIDNPDFATTLAPWPPRLLVMRDSVAERILKDGERNLFARKKTFFATQSIFAEALTGVKFKGLEGFGTKLSNNAEERYNMTNYWLGKPAKTTTKSLIRDAITPSKPVIHMAYAYWESVADVMKLIEDDEVVAERIILCDADLIAAVVERATECRQAAISAESLNVGDADLVEFVAN
jgi:spermidine/putrescine-binding protein